MGLPPVKATGVAWSPSPAAQKASLLASLAVAVLATAAQAQTGAPVREPSAPASSTPSTPSMASPAFPAPLVPSPAPSASADTPAGAPTPPSTTDGRASAPADADSSEKSGQLSLSAALSSLPDETLHAGLVWRIYADAPDPSDAIARPVAETTEATPTLTLKPGAYTAHVSYGYASAMRKVHVSAAGPAAAESARLTINAGGLKVLGAIGDAPIPASQMRVSVYVPVGQDLEGRAVVEGAPPGVVIRLPEGVYHVVSTYGDSNAVMRSDLRVEPGKVTEATLHHRAATITLKLVQTPGGEAFAGTAFSVLTPGGDVIREEIGAFPSVVLAEGDYVVIARYDGKVHTREFKVESGAHRDIEVLAGP